MTYSDNLQRNILIYQKCLSVKEKYKKIECNEALHWWEQSVFVTMNVVKEAATKLSVEIPIEFSPAAGKSFNLGEFVRTGLLIAASEILSW
jgi:hypothetical protein